MSYQVFARKYRPRTFKDVLGQDHVVRTLRNAIDQNRLAHAYLFVGPRGTGKTSTARIFSKALNNPGGPSIDFDPDLPIMQEIAEGSSLDVLEIDGASNNGVEQVRQLRETVQYAPAQSQFKIYYIDEVHMLSNAAFNALLKTLEEPPAHVKFIFATTEPNKILPTIISRCQRFDLRPIPTRIIAEHLLHIAKEESIVLDETAAWAIAKGAEGGMRDAQSMLDQLVAFCGESIKEEDVQHIFGFTSGDTIAKLLGAIFSRETSGALNHLNELSQSGKNLTQLLQELINTLRALLIAKVDAKGSQEGLSDEVWSSLTEVSADCKTDRLLAFIDILSTAESSMRWASNKQLHLELAIIRGVETLDEIRLSDVITALEKGGVDDHLTLPSTTASTKGSEPANDSRPEESSPSEKESLPVSDPVPTSQAPSEGNKLSATFERLLANAPEGGAEPEPAPEPVAKKAAPPKKEAAEKPVKEEIPKPDGDKFYNDPLIKDAIEIFRGKLKA